MFSDPILAAFAAVVARRGDEPLVASPARAWSAARLDAAAAELADRLELEGFAPGQAVGLAAAPGPAFLAGWLALRRVGATPVLCDSVRPTADRREALDRLGVVGFVAEPSGWPGTAGAWSVERRAPTAPPLAADPAWGAIKLSSGSTGEPRGIATPAAALLADDRQLAATMGLGADDRLLAAIPLAHSYGFSSLLLPALVRGSLLVAPEPLAPFAPLAAAATLGATFFPTVPAWLGAYVRLPAPPPLPASVRLVVSAGAPLPSATARAFRVRTGRPVHVFYGASECGGIAFDRVGDAAERGSVGTPVEGVTVGIEEEGGRLVVRSAATAATYVPAPAPELGGGTFTTGDLALLDGGEIVLLGRADDLVIVRGKNVQPREVEEVLREIEGVEDVAVFGADGPDGPRSLLRALVCAPAGRVDYARVVEHCRGRLAEHKVPRSVVRVDEIPRTPRGKLDRAALDRAGA